MDFIRKNLWGIGFVVILGGSLIAMSLASRNSNIPSATGTAKETTQFTITADDHVIGPSDAKVTIVEFSDFQCPACKLYAPILEKLLTDFPKDLRLVYKYFPLKNIHYRAMASAQAAHAAGIQGKFWEMNKLLFENQEKWSQETGTATFEAYATQIGIDVSKFKADYDLGTTKDKIDAELKEGIDLNVNSTPTMYLNGTKLDNPQGYEPYKALITAEIAKINSKK
jgi:protein-disulfide isomerase